MIEFKDISITFDNKTVFRDFSLTLPDKGAVCLFGPSGCGKTTLLNIIAGLLKPQKGNVKGLEHKTVSYVFQSPRLLPWQNVADNIRLVRPCSDEELDKLLKIIDMPDEADSMPDELSGGMKQRVSIARALNFDGDILLLDEPMNGLDAELAARLWQYILQQYENKLVIFITHNRKEAEKYAERIIELQPFNEK